VVGIPDAGMGELCVIGTDVSVSGNGDGEGSDVDVRVSAGIAISVSAALVQATDKAVSRAFVGLV